MIFIYTSANTNHVMHVLYLKVRVSIQINLFIKMSKHVRISNDEEMVLSFSESKSQVSLYQKIYVHVK